MNDAEIHLRISEFVLDHYHYMDESEQFKLMDRMYKWIMGGGDNEI